MTAKLIVGNWKMNGLMSDAEDRTQALIDGVKARKSGAFEMVLCPPFTLIGYLTDLPGSSTLGWGGQDCHAASSGAYTGDISAQMLKDLGCGYVILGHSERRQHHKETSAEVMAKAKAAHAAGLVAIICVGETDEERTAGKQDAVVAGQLAGSLPEGATPQNTVVAYEPVWAIGGDRTPEPKEVAAMVGLIRNTVAGARVLYGGSVTPDNGEALFVDGGVDGFLVGRQSLDADAFTAILKLIDGTAR